MLFYNWALSIYSLNVNSNQELKFSHWDKQQIHLSLDFFFSFLFMSYLTEVYHLYYEQSDTLIAVFLIVHNYSFFFS